MKQLILVLCLIQTTFTFAQSRKNIDRGIKKIQACSGASRGEVICTATFINRKLNRILNKLNSGGSCELKICTYKGDINDPEEISRCDSGSNGVYVFKSFKVKSEEEAKTKWFSEMSDSEGDGRDSVKEVNCF